MNHQVAIVMSEVFLRRLTPSLTAFVRRQQDYRIVSIHRPIAELKTLLTELNPAGRWALSVAGRDRDKESTRNNRGWLLRSHVIAK